MGIFSTLTSFGAGYVAGAVTGPRAKQRLSATVEQLPDATKERLPERLTNAIGDATVDVRSIREVMTEHPRTVSLSSTLQDAARVMAEDAISNVIVDDAVGRVAASSPTATSRSVPPQRASIPPPRPWNKRSRRTSRPWRRPTPCRTPCGRCGERHPPASRRRGRQGDRHRLARRDLDPDRARVRVVGHQRRHARPLKLVRLGNWTSAP